MPIKKKNDDLKSELNRLLPIHSNDDPNHVWNKNQQQMLTKGTGIDSKWIRKMRNQEGEKLSVDVLYDVSYKLSSNVESLKNTWPFHMHSYSKEEEAEQIKKIVNDGLIPGICYKKIVFDESKAGKLTRETKKIFYFEINKYLSYLFEKWSHSKEYKGEKKNKWARFDHLVNLLDFKQKWEAALKNNVRDAFSMFGTIDNDFAIEIKKLLSNSLYEINGLKMVDGEDLRIEYKESIFVDKKEIEKKIPENTKDRDAKINEKHKQEEEEWQRDIMKSVCAFINTDGGELMIGVKNNREIAGMAKELKVWRERKYGNAKKFKNKNSKKMELINKEILEDEYELHIDNLIKEHFSDHLGKFPDTKIEDLPKIKKKIFSIKVERTSGLDFAFVKEKFGKKTILVPYIRQGSTDQKMEGAAWDKYQRDFRKKSDIK